MKAKTLRKSSSRSRPLMVDKTAMSVRNHEGSAEEERCRADLPGHSLPQEESPAFAALRASFSAAFASERILHEVLASPLASRLTR